MKPTHCPRSPELIQALRTGTPDAGFEAHLRTCTACRETRAVSSLLLRHAAAIADEHQLPPAVGRVWRRAQEQRKALALRRATRLMTIMGALGAVYLVALGGWCLHLLRQHYPSPVAHALTALTAGSVPVGIAAAAVLLVGGAASLLLLGTRPRVELRL